MNKNAEWEMINGFVNSSDNNDDNINDRQITIGNLLLTVRRNMLIHVAKLLLNDTTNSVWGEFVRDLIRFDNGIIDTNAFNSINVYSEIVLPEIMGTTINDLCEVLRTDSRFIQVTGTTVNDVRYSHIIHIVGEIPYNNLQYNFTINFTSGKQDICACFDLDTDTLVIRQWNTHTIVSEIPQITLGKVVSNILEKKFNILRTLNDPFSLKTDSDNLKYIRMTIRIMKMYDNDWICLDNNLDSDIYHMITKIPDSPCDNCNVESKHGIWSVTKDCCNKSICLECLDKKISFVFFEYMDQRIFSDCLCTEPFPDVCY